MVKTYKALLQQRCMYHKQKNRTPEHIMNQVIHYKLNHLVVENF